MATRAQTEADTELQLGLLTRQVQLLTEIRMLLWVLIALPIVGGVIAAVVAANN
jgi:hypothetical protein